MLNQALCPETCQEEQEGKEGAEGKEEEGEGHETREEMQKEGEGGGEMKEEDKEREIRFLMSSFHIRVWKIRRHSI